MTLATPSAPHSAFRTVVSQAIFVLAFGATFAALANHFSPRGLALSRDYFPSAIPLATPDNPIIPDQPTPAIAHEFASVSRAEVEALTRDTRFVTQKLLLIDARNLATYRAGHIPGALQYDHFRPTENISQIVPACLNAEKIILYCHGGTCEDSIFAARLLVGYGVPAARLAIYEKGFEDWRTAQLPLQSP